LLYLLWDGSEFKLDTAYYNPQRLSPYIDLAVDKRGFPHIAYGESNLLYIRGYEGGAVKEKREKITTFLIPPPFQSELIKEAQFYDAKGNLISPNKINLLPAGIYFINKRGSLRKVIKLK